MRAEAATKSVKTRRKSLLRKGIDLQMEYLISLRVFSLRESHPYGEVASFSTLCGTARHSCFRNNSRKRPA